MKKRLVVIFLVAFALCAAVTKSHVTSWNDGSRVATVDSLIANHTLVIDRSAFYPGLGDKILFQGKHYSDKPPLLSLLAAGVALLLLPLGITLRHTPGAAIYLITLFTVGVAFGIGCCYAYAFQRLLGFGERIALAVAALTGTGTLALSYATVLTNHVPCGTAVLAGCYHLVRGRAGSTVQNALAGLMFGIAFAFDSSSVLLTAAAAVLLWGAPVRRWLLCIAAGAPFVILQLAYNAYVSGSIVPTAFTGSVWTEFPLKPGTTGPTPFMLYSFTDYLWFAVNLLAGGKGLFSYTPLALVACYGLFVMRNGSENMRRLAIAIAAACVVYFISIVALQNDFDARHFGERRFVDLFFLLCVALGPALASIRSTRAALVVRACIAVSIAIAALGTIAPFGGEAGEPGFVFAGAAFSALLRRTPLQGAFDVLLLLVIIALVLRFVPLPGIRTAGRELSRAET